MLNILVLCKSGRLHAIVLALLRTRRPVQIFALSEADNPFVRKLVTSFRVARTDDVEAVLQFAKECSIDMVVIGPEEPLAAGVVDALEEIGIGCVGPRRAAARIEWSKAFARELLAGCMPAANPRHRFARSMDEARVALRELPAFVIKPDGLTGGKGVKVFGDHLHTAGEGLQYVQAVFDTGCELVLIEEKLDGEEFTLQSFCDGTHVVHTFPIQDHKRRDNGDKGPNTGGMGSYSCANHSLPFLEENDLETARQVNEIVCRRIAETTGSPFKGILYGGFIATRDGVKVIEFNSRFGDPEAMNVLPLLETDFVEVCEAIVKGNLNQEHVRFKRAASVCKYVVPASYPDAKSSEVIDVRRLPEESQQLQIYFASVNEHSEGCLRLMGSRAIAFVGLADSVEEAAAIAEAAASSVQGPVHHRTDIGTPALLKARTEHMRKLRSTPKTKAHAA